MKGRDLGELDRRTRTWVEGLKGTGRRGPLGVTEDRCNSIEKDPVFCNTTFNLR